MIVLLFLCFAVGYCYEAHPWKAKYLQLEQQYKNCNRKCKRDKRQNRPR